MAAITLAEIRAEGLLEEKTRKLPPWAREYVEELEVLLDGVRADLEAQQDALDFDQVLAYSWRQVAVLRTQAGDDPGAIRAWRAYHLMERP